MSHVEFIRVRKAAIKSHDFVRELEYVKFIYRERQRFTVKLWGNHINFPLPNTHTL